VPPAETPDILLIRQTRPDVAGRLAERFRLHRLEEAPDREAFLDAVGPRIRGLAVGAMCPIDARLFDRLPQLEIVASFGVGYDTIDAGEAHRRGIVVTHTPDVLWASCSPPSARSRRPTATCAPGAGGRAASRSPRACGSAGSASSGSAGSDGRSPSGSKGSA
jgi:hypothetical protein